MGSRFLIVVGLAGLVGCGSVSSGKMGTGGSGAGGASTGGLGAGGAIGTGGVVGIGGAAGSTVAVADAAADSVDAASPLSCAAPMAEWLFNEGLGTTTADRSGNQHTLNLFATTWTLDTRDGTPALTFDGSTSYGQAPYDLAFRATRTLSLTAWIRPASIAAACGGLVVKGDRAGPVQDWGFYTCGAEIGALFNWPTGTTAMNNPGGDPVLSSGLGLAAGVWTFIGIVLDVDAGHLSFYKNGTFVSSVSWTAPLLQNDAAITVGTDAGTPNPWAGNMDGVAVWSCALSAGDITSLYTSGYP